MPASREIASWSACCATPVPCSRRGARITTSSSIATCRATFPADPAATSRKLMQSSEGSAGALLQLGRTEVAGAAKIGIGDVCVDVEEDLLQSAEDLVDEGALQVLAP